MATRKQIHNKIRNVEDKIKALHDELIELHRQDALLSDALQWFIEQEEQYFELRKVEGKRNRKKFPVTKLVGRIHYNQGFKDDDTGEIVTIERSQVVRINGEWV